MSEPVLRAQGIRKTYRSGDKRIEVLRGVDLALRPGENISIRGASGSGKTTLIHLLAGLDSCEEGDLLWEGRPVRPGKGGLARRRTTFLGMVFQAFYLVPELNALENVLLPARIAGVNIREATERARGLLDRVGLEERVTHLPTQLSGGEMQRVAIARALMNHPRVILADEPTGNLDEVTGGVMMDLLLSVCAEAGTALVLVTHNRPHAERMERRLELHLGLLNDTAFAPPAGPPSGGETETGEPDQSG